MDASQKEAYSLPGVCTVHAFFINLFSQLRDFHHFFRSCSRQILWQFLPLHLFSSPSSARTDSHSYASAVKAMSSSSSGTSSTPRRIVIDDTNSRIQYVGPWGLDTRHTQDGLGNFGDPFQGSVHGVVDSTASFSFTFEGA